VEFTVFLGDPGQFFAVPQTPGPLFWVFAVFLEVFAPGGLRSDGAVFPFLGDLQSAPSYFWTIVFAWVRVRSLIIRFGFWLSRPYQT
jgi:hypothetical protein